MAFIKLTDHVDNLKPVLDFLVPDRSSLVMLIELLSKKASNGSSLWSFLYEEQIKNVLNFILVKMTDVDMDFYASVPDDHKEMGFPHMLLLCLFQTNLIAGELILDHAKKNIPDIIPAIIQMTLGLSDGFDILRDIFTQRVSFSSPQKFWDLLADCPQVKENIKKNLAQHIRGMNLEEVTGYYETLCLNANKENITSAWFNTPTAKPSAFILFLQKEIRREYESYNLKTHTAKKRKTLRI
jgi:hypothetical protein